MERDLVNNISRYISYFRRQVQFTNDHCPNTIDGELHSRILYMAILDAISRSVFFQEKNRDRVVKFISEFCDWPENNRISLSHLSKLVTSKTNPQLARLRNYAIKNFNQWIPLERISLSRDPKFDDVALLWPRVGEKYINIDGVDLINLQHSHLLYTYRNNLMHEFRTPGRHVELWDIDQPYYATLSEYKDDMSSTLVRTWELQYPVRFFRRLCNAGLNNLEEYFINTETDPIKSIDWGNYWIKGLNS